MSAPEDLIRACKLDKTQVERLRGSYQKELETPAVLIWHGPGDITTMAGLRGKFNWPENPLAPPPAVSFTVDDVEDGKSNGTYTLATAPGGVTLEQGKFVAYPSNTAIGPVIGLTPQGADGRMYSVKGMLTDENWTIYSMHLVNVGSNQHFWPARMSPSATT